MAEKTERTLSSIAQRQVSDRAPQRWNRRIGWFSLCAGVGSGMVMGLWSFGGPVPVPEWIGGYDQLSRRLIRLGHIAFVGLGMINVLVARELKEFSFPGPMKRVAAVTMNLGNALLPVSLIAAGVSPPFRYFLVLPAASVFLALIVTAVGVCRTELP